MRCLPPLPYDYSALEPHFDARTMEIHHTKHHQTYIDKLNAALDQYSDLQEKSLPDLLKNLNTLPETIRLAVRNHGGGHANHSLFWQILTPNSPISPEGELLVALNTAFGSLDSFKSEYTAKATAHFGSGWTWLVSTPTGLSITTTPNQDSPLMQDHTPLLGLDLWEHAYYLKYQNRRPDYISAFWNLVNWTQVQSNFSNLT